METHDRETLETVERAREQHRSLDEQLKVYRRDRERYERTIRGGHAKMPASSPITDGTRRATGTAPQVVRGSA